MLGHHANREAMEVPVAAEFRAGTTSLGLPVPSSKPEPATLDDRVAPRDADPKTEFFASTGQTVHRSQNYQRTQNVENLKMKYTNQFLTDTSRDDVETSGRLS